MTDAIQDLYSDEHAHCFGCGHRNTMGIQLKSYLNDAATSASITPPAHYTGGIPNHLFGGMVASLLDCHGTASAAAFYQQHLRQSDKLDATLERFVTANLNIDYINPTPINQQLTLKGTLVSIEGRKVRVSLTLTSGQTLCARATMLAVKLMAS